MKVFFDTSVLLPVFYADHPRHEESAAVFHAENKRQSACAAHSAAELYATLTRLPVRPRIAADQAMLFIKSLRERVTLVSLEGDDYFDTLLEISGRQLIGGVVYDGVIAACARKVRASVLYTWNPADFERLKLDHGPVIRTPDGR
ncbi:MAG: PIN domain-containing protein [Bryobacterales bacterium]